MLQQQPQQQLITTHSLAARHQFAGPKKIAGIIYKELLNGNSYKKAPRHTPTQ